MHHSAPFSHRLTSSKSLIGDYSTNPKNPSKQAGAATDRLITVSLSAVVAVAGVFLGREVYQGMFGPWSIEPADEFEVLTYRVGLTATWAGENSLPALIRWSQLLEHMQRSTSPYSRVCTAQTFTAECACCPYTGGAPQSTCACAPAGLDLRDLFQACN
jgi:hypothetical protein